MKTLLHVDMDAFFASVEILDHPEWAGKPVIVGSDPHERGVVSTCSYAARKFGVHSAMPSRTAYALCPKAIFVRPRMERYQEVSEKAFAVFERFTPYVEGVSIDEAFLDITGSLHLYESARAMGEALRQAVQRECGVTCSVGIAPNRLLAKIGSELNKPNGLTLMPFEPAEIAAFLAPRPVSTLWGVGKKSAEEMRRFGIITCGDLQTSKVARFAAFRDMAFGRSDDTVHWQAEAEKSVSREYTFKRDESVREVVRAELLALVADVGRRFRRERRWAMTARLKIRDASFTTYTRQLAFARPARDDLTFQDAALTLFDREFSVHNPLIGPKVRLIGFGVTNFCTDPTSGEQLLFADPEAERSEKREHLFAAIDGLRERGHNVGAPNFCYNTHQ